MWPPSLWLEKKNSWKRKLLSNQHLSLKVSILGSLARPQQGNHKPQTPHPNKSYLSSSGFYNVEPLVHSCKEHWKYTLDPFILEALTIAPQPTKTNLLCRVPKKIHDRLCNESLKKSRLIMVLPIWAHEALGLKKRPANLPLPRGVPRGPFASPWSATVWVLGFRAPLKDL